MTMENSPPIDRISNLPDELLCHILSFLPTKLAFTTTVLSKRWTPLFKLLTTLRFDDQSVHNQEESFFHICHFIDTVMLSAQSVKTIHLNFRSLHTNRFNFKHWIETVKRKPVENLHILSLFIPLPRSIFKFPSLVVLTLKLVDVTGNISVDLPSLKILHLIDVDFKIKRSFNNLLYGCPILEDLATHFSYRKRRTEGVTVRAGEFKSLSNLITADINALDFPLRAISNVKILKLRMRKRLLEINSNDGGFPVFQNLINLNISFYKFRRWNDLVGVLQYCPKLQILCIFKLAVTEHRSINWRYPNSVPECISSHLRSCSINYEGWEDELRFTKYILQNAYFLEVMKINISHSLNPNLHPLEELSSVPMISPQCKLSIG